MKIKVLNETGTNSYIVEDEISKETLIIDPVDKLEKYEKQIKENNLNVKYIYLTHLHYDHILNAQSLKELTNAKILIGKEDAININNSNYVLKEGITHIKVDEKLQQNDKITLGNESFCVIETPGHTKGSTSLLNENEKIIFTGDALFNGTYGRYDLPSGSLEDTKQTLKKLLSLDKTITVFPGHGDYTTIGNEQDLI